MHMDRPFITCLANTEQNLYFYVRDVVKVVLAEAVEVPTPLTVITGPKSRPVGLLFGDDHLMIKVIFHPTGSFRLLNIDMTLTVNNGLDATSFWGDQVIVVLQQLKSCASYDDMASTVFSFLETKSASHCRPPEAIDEVAIKMAHAQNMHTQLEWAEMACLSPRQFERNFIRRVGISPKLFNRIARFEQVMKIKDKAVDKTWIATALDCGYADTSHLFKDFKEFSNFPPAQFYLHNTSGHTLLSSG